MASHDADFRFMALTDLNAYLTSPSFKDLDDYTQEKVSQSVIQLLNDSQSQIQNLSIQW